MFDDRWTYKGHVCTMEDVGDEDCRKAWHEVVTPDGRRLFADISPYDWRRCTVEMWIDAGYPKRRGIGPLQREDLVPRCDCGAEKASVPHARWCSVA